MWKLSFLFIYAAGVSGARIKQVHKSSDPLSKVCVISANGFPETPRGAVTGATDSQGGTQYIQRFQLMAEQMMTQGQCIGAGVIALATQEMHSTWYRYAKKGGDTFIVNGIEYEAKAVCGGMGSAASTIMVLKSEAGRVEDSKCDFVGHEKFGWNVNTIKSTAIAQINMKTSDAGYSSLIFASSHLDRKGIGTQIAQFHEGMQKVKHMSENFQHPVLWGGDFNSRTLADREALKGKVGSPADLNTAKDIFGQEDEHLETFELVLQRETSGSLVEIPGVRALCPTYYKKPSGNSKRWTCHVDGQADEYYDLAKDGRIPSWPDRLFSSSSFRCRGVSKISTKADHDPVFSLCELP